MLKNFFKLNTPYKEFNEEMFATHLETSKHICNVLYVPDTFEEESVEGKTFENVSFSKTRIFRTTFRNCTFKDCLFIGTSFDSVDFYDCSFENCNFYKATLHNVYGRPSQFRKVITDEQYANVAVHLYHQLRANYYQQSQREYKNEAEYFFLRWKRKNDYHTAKRLNKKLYLYLPRHVGSYLYGCLFGYGYRVRNLAISTLVSVTIATFLNYQFTQYFFEKPVEPSIIKTIYFTLTTMVTLGASGYSPDTNIGYLFVLLNVIFGISILSATISAVFKKVNR